MKKMKNNIRQLTTIGFLGGICIVLGLTPLGLIPIGVINATTMHIPVLLAGITSGPFVGGAVGLIFGLYSLANAYMRPTITSFVFWNPLVSVLPRILLGVIAGYLYLYFKKRKKPFSKYISIAIWAIMILFLIYRLWDAVQKDAGILTTILLLIASVILLVWNVKLKDQNPEVLFTTMFTSLAHTVMVLGSIYLFYGARYMEAIGQPAESALSALTAIGITNGIPEMVVATIIIPPIAAAYEKWKK
ncbi:ECF transporter S component [Gallicola sp. Sow4_E12]|uniref:ECF transporter S component n=1 Tax=Gallicola sp. Sow4_E12 TaxID=3438785 RepID=UPI003F93A13E